MNYERALIAQARPQVLAAKARTLVEHEIAKGCLPALSPLPLALEPPFLPIACLRDGKDIFSPPATITEPLPAPSDLVYLRIWVSPDHPLDWKRNELFLKQLQAARHRVTFCIAGNAERIDMGYVCHREDVPVLATIFRGEFETAEIAPSDSLPWNTDSFPIMSFRDYYPPPPYTTLLSRPDEILFSPYESFLRALTLLEPPTVGIYQAVFQSVAPDHDWHQNVQILLDLEFFMKQVSGFQPFSRYTQQGPSGDLRHMANEVVTKGHPDKPFFVVAARTALLGNVAEAAEMLRALTPFMGLFQHGGHPLEWIDESDYAHTLDVQAIRNMFTRGSVHRHGWLVNSWELASLVHVPPGELIEQLGMAVSLLAPVKFQQQPFPEGISIGTCEYADQQHPVFIEELLRRRHTHVVGAPGTGKSTTLEDMVCQDIEAGTGVMVLDPHGDLVERLLGLIPQEHADRVIYLDPGDMEWIPLWNPMQIVPGQDISQTADNLVTALRNTASGWGDRIEFLLRNAFLALLQRPGSTLMDAARLLRKDGADNSGLRDEILPLLENDLSRAFWLRDLNRYRDEATSVAQHKLGKLLLAGPVAFMLGQPESRFTLHQVMEENLVLLANLSTVSTETRQVLGQFLLSLIYLTALARSKQPASQRKAFRVYCDEAHLFLADPIEDILAGMRKFNVGLTLAHQYMNQFKSMKADALAEAGSSIIFRVDSKDAEYLCRGLMGKAQPKDLIRLEDYHAVARIGSKVYYIRTPDPRRPLETNCRERIIAESRRKYCAPADTLRRNTGTTVKILVRSRTGGKTEHDEFLYDEFEARRPPPEKLGPTT